MDYELPQAPECPWCFCEAEVVEYYRDVVSKKRIGFLCRCGARVQYGRLIQIGMLV